MSTVSSRDLVSQLQWRYATKRFDATRKIPAADWASLEQALVLSPSSYGLQPWKFLLIETPALRAKLRGAAFGQSQVEDASHFVVFAARRSITEADVERHVARIVAVRGVPRTALDTMRGMIKGDLLEGPRSKSTDQWAARQCYLALGNLLASAAVVGIDACPMEGIAPDQFDEILGLAGSEHRTLVACALGYRHPEDKYAAFAKVRFAPEDVIVRK